ncbi:MAG: hypothetical protein K6B40_04535 [Firmicutes bacterium]|nr:hypothetical protein [Bacillota bacterium]
MKKAIFYSNPCFVLPLHRAAFFKRQRLADTPIAEKQESRQGACARVKNKRYSVEKPSIACFL